MLKALVATIALLAGSAAALATHNPGQPSPLPATSYVVRVHSTANQSIPHNTSTNVQFGTADLDPASQWDSAGKAKINLSSSLNGKFVFASGSANWFQHAHQSAVGLIHYNSSNVIQHFWIGVQSSPGAGTASRCTCVSGIFKAATGDYIVLQVYQFSGGSVNVLSGNDTQFSMVPL